MFATLALVRNIYNINLNSVCDIRLLLKEASCPRGLELNIYIEDFKKGPGCHLIHFSVNKSHMLGGMPGKQVAHVSVWSAHPADPSGEQPVHTGGCFGRTEPEKLGMQQEQ